MTKFKRGTSGRFMPIGRQTSMDITPARPSITGKDSPTETDYQELASQFYFELLTAQPSCFKRNIVRANRDGIIAAHIKRAKAYDAMPDGVGCG